MCAALSQSLAPTSEPSPKGQDTPWGFDTPVVMCLSRENHPGRGVLLSITETGGIPHGMAWLGCALGWVGSACRVLRDAGHFPLSQLREGLGHSLLTRKKWNTIPHAHPAAAAPLSRLFPALGASRASSSSSSFLSPADENVRTHYDHIITPSTALFPFTNRGAPWLLLGQTLHPAHSGDAVTNLPDNPTSALSANSFRCFLIPTKSL